MTAAATLEAPSSGMAETAQPASNNEPNFVSPEPARPIDPAAQSARRAEAAAWLGSLPTRTTFWSRDAAHERGWGTERLAMHRRSASSPEFWEKQWLVSPSEPMTGRRLVRWYRDLFLRHLPRADEHSPGNLIVEAGCGNGNVLRMCANEGLRMEGLDFAAAAVEANRRIDSLHQGRYRVGDVRDLPYADGQLGGYISLGVVEHFDESERAVILREAARVLRPGGVALISVPHFNLARRIRARMGGYDQPATSQPQVGRLSEPAVPAPHLNLEFYQYFLRSSEIAAQIERTGLRIIDIDGYDVRYGLTSTIGGGVEGWGARIDSALGRLASRSKWWARRVDHPPKPLRRAFSHMTIIVARKD